MHSPDSTHNLICTPAEKLTRADDLMSDILDCFLWPTVNHSSIPSKRTIKFSADYRRPRALNIADFRQIIHSIQTGKLRNLSEATTLIRQLPAVVTYLSNAEPPRLGKHIGLYLQLFLPKCGIRFCETDRYNQRRDDLKSNQKKFQSTPSSTQSKKRKSKIRPNELRDLLSSSRLSPNFSPKHNSTRSNGSYLPMNNLTHLAVFAAKDYLPNDIIFGCEGSFADLTEEEDLKLRSNAHLQSNPSTHFHRESTDFSHIVNSRGKFQVFCGPARFVNHDCKNNVELLREGFTIKFKVVKPIKAGEEILTSYGMNYFGERNCECMCATCEQNGKGFYSERDLNKQLSEEEPEIKKECDELNPSASLAIDTTDLSSLADVSDGSLSRASNTPALECSPAHSYSNTPSQVRRQLALSSQLLTTPLPERSESDSHSRSPSTRRHKNSQLDPTQSNINSANFVSSAKFIPTNDLTLPILSKAKHPSPQPIIIDYQPSESPKSAGTPDSIDPKSLPVKRKTYWITTKQKQLGQVPWESDSTMQPPVASSHQSYSPVTPSLLGPTRRNVTEQPPAKKEAIQQPAEVPVAKAPVRSYWVSTKEKKLGIVPWEPNPPQATPAEASMATTRSTRASRRASEGTPSIDRFPTAPKGSKLSYKVFGKGTQEAQLLSTAIGRELLGFRPRASKKKKTDAEPETPDQANPLPLIDQPNQAEKSTPDGGSNIVDTLEEISSFLMDHPNPPALAPSTPLTQLNTNNLEAKIKSNDGQLSQLINTTPVANHQPVENGKSSTKDQSAFDDGPAASDQLTTDDEMTTEDGPVVKQKSALNDGLAPKDGPAGNELIVDVLEDRQQERDPTLLLSKNPNNCCGAGEAKKDDDRTDPGTLIESSPTHLTPSTVDCVLTNKRNHQLNHESQKTNKKARLEEPDTPLKDTPPSSLTTSSLLSLSYSPHVAF